VGKYAGQLEAASLLPTRAEDEDLVSRVVAENMPKATAKRRLGPRTTKLV